MAVSCRLMRQPCLHCPELRSLLWRLFDLLSLSWVGLDLSFGFGSVTVPSCTGNDMVLLMSMSGLVVSGVSFSYLTDGQLN